MDTSKITQQIVMDALQRSGVKVVPVTDEQARLFVQDVAERNRAQFSAGLPDTFNSTASMVLDSIRQEKATPSQWLSMLTNAGGIKTGEDAWTGLSEWLRTSGEKTLTKADVREYINLHQLIVKETEYGVPESSNRLCELQAEMDNYIQETDGYGSENRYDHYEDAFQAMVDDYGDDFDQAFGHDNGKLYIYNSACAAEFLGIEPINDIRRRYTTPGLDDYKELAFYTDNTPSWQAKEDNDVHFNEVGWQQPGQCVAWVRFGTKTDRSTGFKTLVIDEVQSARHQKGQKDGYIHQDIVNGYDRYNQDIAIQNEKYFLCLRNWRTKLDIPHIDEKTEQELLEIDPVLREIKDQRSEISRQKKEFVAQHEEVLNLYFMDKLVPAAPFEKNWHEVCIKRMLRYAAEYDFDRITWTTAEQQAERYKLGEVVNRISSESYKAQSPNEVDGFDIEIYTDEGKTFLFVDKTGVICSGEWQDKDLTDKPLSKLIGQSLANRILSSEGQLELSEEVADFRIGHEGMVTLYDEKIHGL